MATKTFLCCVFLAIWGHASAQSTVPAARPPPAERLFNSTIIEELIANVSTKISDPTIRQIFENCLPSTLDTTVYWQRPSSPEFPLPYTYIVTGDILGMWLRDSTYQVNPYVPLAATDHDLSQLILGLINTQAEQILTYPHANAYFPLKHWESDIPLDPHGAAANDTVHPVYEEDEVFEAKYELDSLASFLYLTKYFYEETGNSDFLGNPAWKNATDLVLQTMIDMQGGTLEVLGAEPYTFTRPSRTQTETQNLYGLGNPVKRCGLVRSFFRPSDDSTIFQYLIPSNAMAVIGLRGVADMLTKENAYPALANALRRLADEIDTAINKYGVVQHPEFGTVYAYEVDCYGSVLFMDDANFPSLLSLPKFGYVNRNDSVYLNTRKYILDPDWNPYCSRGTFSGIGSPHTGLQQTWHMALAMQGMTTLDEEEITEVLIKLRDSTNGTGFMHESFDVNDPSKFSRDWFAWANTVFGDFILYLVEYYPHILQEGGHFKMH